VLSTSTYHSPTIVEQKRLTARALLDPPLFDMLEEAGYTTRVLTGPIVHAQVGGADVTWSSGAATDFELNLLQRTLAAGVTSTLGWETAQQHDGIVSTLDEFARPVAGPVFTLGHVMAPHAPFVIRADGSAEAAPPCYPAACGIFHGESTELGWSPGQYREKVAGQIEALDRLVLSSVDRIRANDPEAVILVFSDHGLRFDRTDHDEQFRNLLTAYTPNHSSLFGESPTLVNVMPRLLNAYFQAGISLLPDTLYEAGDDPWLELTPKP
jgi:hypothetical protein